MIYDCRTELKIREKIYIAVKNKQNSETSSLANLNKKNDMVK